MKDNKDEEKTLFQAIDAVDDKFLMETLKDTFPHTCTP